MSVFDDVKAIAPADLKPTYTTAITAAGADADRQGARESPRVVCFQSDLSPYPWTFEARIPWNNPDPDAFFAAGNFSDLQVDGDAHADFCFRILLYVLKSNGY